MHKSFLALSLGPQDTNKCIAGDEKPVGGVGEETCCFTSISPAVVAEGGAWMKDTIGFAFALMEVSHWGVLQETLEKCLE